MKNDSVLAAALALCFAAAPTDAQPQAPQPDAPSTFTETIDVRVVNVDVWVTDRDGNPVTGLQADDFEVRENGQLVELSNFYELTDGLDGGARQRPARDSRGAAPPPSDLNRFIPAEPPPPEHRLSLMVYLDNYNLTPADRNRLLPFLRDFLSAQLTPYDRVMLAVGGQGGFEVVLPFTTEAWRVAEATHEVEDRTGARRRTESERALILRDLNNLVIQIVETDYQLFLRRIRDFAATVGSEADASLGNLGHAIRTMAGLPGRKGILHISNGLPMRPAEDLFRALEERFTDPRGRWTAECEAPPILPRRCTIDVANAYVEANQYDLSRHFDDLASLANASGVTFYTVAAARLSVSGMSAANLRFSTGIDLAHAGNLEEPLLRIADRTGGRAIVNTGSFAAGFDRIASDLRNRYSLGYSPRSPSAPSPPSSRRRSPTRAERGRSHRIEVELTEEARERHRGRLTLRHRDSYVDKPVAEEMADLTLAALTMGETANSMGVRVAPVPSPDSQRRLDNGDIQSRLLVTVPIGPLSLVPVAENHEGKVRLWVQVMDDEGGASEVTEHSVSVLVKEGEIEDARQRSWPFAVDVVTRPGPHRVAVGVRDDLAATTSVVAFDLDPGNAPTAVAEAPPQPDETERWLAEAAAHYQRGQLEEMANAARRALELTDRGPGARTEEDNRLRARAYNALGVALFGKPGRTEQDVLEAEDAFRRVIALRDDDASVAPRYSLARLLVDSGRPAEGVAEARSILAISPEGPIPDRARILVCHSRGSAGEEVTKPPEDAAANSDRRPGEMIHQAAHGYTDEAIGAGVEGVVGLGVSIDEEGCVVHVEELERLPHGLTESAVAAMRRAVFRPAMENGEPVGATYRTAVRFTLDGR